uniref:AP2/ERF domain-containing protein n=1 Tax=Macrostomum lignano TaxID=282301 RepID=A0A1I8JND1_9PLAT
MTSVEQQQHREAGGVRCYYELLEAAGASLASGQEPGTGWRRPPPTSDWCRRPTRRCPIAQERAWYDKHRERILKRRPRPRRRLSGGASGRLPVLHLRLLRRLRRRRGRLLHCVRPGVQRSGRGGAAGLRRRRRTRRLTFQSFGRSDSPYDTVVRPFYAHWETFFTRKSYVWVEKYDTREAPNKYARKAMEKENRAARDAARRERKTKRFELWLLSLKSAILGGAPNGAD